MKVIAAEPSDFAWIQGRTGCEVTSSSTAIKAVDASGRIRGMVLYCATTPNMVQAHMAADSPIVWRSLAGPAFRYPFEANDKKLLVGIIPADNERSVQLAQRFGFREAYRIRRGWSDGVDLIVFEMRREECRYLQHRKAA